MKVTLLFIECFVNLNGELRNLQLYYASRNLTNFGSDSFITVRVQSVNVNIITNFVIPSMYRV